MGNTLAIGAPSSHSFDGIARVYKFLNSDWQEIAHIAPSPSESDSFGRAVSLNADGSLLAIVACGEGGVAPDRYSVYRIEE
jgi:hypothetical protein